MLFIITLCYIYILSYIVYHCFIYHYFVIYYLIFITLYYIYVLTYIVLKIIGSDDQSLLITEVKKEKERATARQPYWKGM